jgi:hypothetical protein
MMGSDLEPLVGYLFQNGEGMVTPLCEVEHFAEPNEQNTQQSPALGRITTWHDLHS